MEQVSYLYNENRIKDYLNQTLKTRDLKLTLSVVSEEINQYTICRGLQCFQNCIKNKVPHHLASQLWSLFLFKY